MDIYYHRETKLADVLPQFSIRSPGTRVHIEIQRASHRLHLSDPVQVYHTRRCPLQDTPSLADATSASVGYECFYWMLVNKIRLELMDTL
jgi:hypothetical protein